MFLHELSRKVSQNWAIRVEGVEYESLVRQTFGNCCPYCLCTLGETPAIIEHLDGMNRYRVGLHVPGNVLVACRKCNSEKRRDDSATKLTLGESGWASFLSHDGTRCTHRCPSCKYWESVWPNPTERQKHLRENIERIKTFRGLFVEFERLLPGLNETLPSLLAKLYIDCQNFAASEIKSLLQGIGHARRS